MLERIAGIIREQLNLDNVEITEETSFKDYEQGKRAVLSKDRQPVLAWQKNVWHGK